MYVHSYQSYIWNTLVSKRIRESGLKCILGDLVIKEGNIVFIENLENGDM